MKESNTETKSKDTISLDFAIGEYFNIAKNLKNYSDATISSYRADFNQFKKFLESNGDDSTDITTITPALIEDFCLGLLEKKLSINSVHRKKDALSSLFRHCVKRRWIDRNPVEQVQLARKKKSVRQVFLDRQQIKKFIMADARVKGYSNLTLLAVKMTLCFTGVRNQELRKLNWEDIDFDLNIIRIFNSKNTDKKGNSDGLDREIPICSHLRTALKKIQADTGPVFRNIKGTRITKDALAALVERSSRFIKTKLPLTPHCLRHSLSSSMEKVGACHSDVALVLGHRPDGTTSGYIHSSIDRVAELIEKLSESVIEEKNDDYEEKNGDVFNNQQRGVSCTPQKFSGISSDVQKRRNIVISIEKVSEAEKIWCEINGDKCMPASFLIGYVLNA